MNEVMKSLCSRLPLWTAVMTRFFKSPNIVSNSSNVESNFNKLKNIVMHDVKLPIRLDTFLTKFVKSLNGSAKLMMIQDQENFADGLSDNENGEVSKNQISMQNMCFYL